MAYVRPIRNDDKNPSNDWAVSAKAAQALMMDQS